MTAIEILQSVQFVVDQEGNPTAAVLDIKAWGDFLDKLENIEDIEIVRNITMHYRLTTLGANFGWYLLDNNNSFSDNEGDRRQTSLQPSPTKITAKPFLFSGHLPGLYE